MPRPSSTTARCILSSCRSSASSRLVRGHRGVVGRGEVVRQLGYLQDQLAVALHQGVLGLAQPVARAVRGDGDGRLGHGHDVLEALVVELEAVEDPLDTLQDDVQGSESRLAGLFLVKLEALRAIWVLTLQDQAVSLVGVVEEIVLDYQLSGYVDVTDEIVHPGSDGYSSGDMVHEGQNDVGLRRSHGCSGVVVCVGVVLKDRLV
ncbi:hypothetical protein PG987_008867 [Apiospora arundinis]